MNFPENLRYTKEHEWAQKEGSAVVIGITDHAQSSLGDIVFLELPKVGRELKAHETFGVVESIKAVSDLYAPLAGKVVAINEALTQEPAKINTAPYTWMIKIEPSDAGAFDKLMSQGDYVALVKSL